MGNCKSVVRDVSFWLTVSEMVLSLVVAALATETWIVFIPMWFRMLFFVFVILTIILMSYILDEDPVYFQVFFLNSCIVLYIIGAVLLIVSIFHYSGNDGYEHSSILWPIVALILCLLLIIIMLVHAVMKCIEMKHLE